MQAKAVFFGTNNRVQKITGVIPDSSYLLGNAYPSALDAEAFDIDTRFDGESFDGNEFVDFYSVN